MVPKKYLNLDGLNQILEKLSQKFAALIHQHDDRYYTETEIDRLVGTESVASQISGSATSTLASAEAYTDEQIEDTAGLLNTKIAEKAKISDLTSHTNNKSNPHGVTLSQLGITATAAELNVLNGVVATAAELNYVKGTTSNIQNQLDTISNLIENKNALMGMATQITPLQVAQAIIDGLDVVITYQHDYYGLLCFTAFLLAPDMNIVASSGAFVLGNDVAVCQLAGDIPNGIWECTINQLAQMSDIPTIPTIPTHLPNPEPIYFTGGVNAIYNGANGLDVYIPVINTESITSALGFTPADTEDVESHIGNTSNPHGVTKGQLGLGNVENKSSSTIRSELTKSNVTTALGYTPPTTNTTYDAATQSTSGLMSADDKKKLDGIASGANAYSLPTASSSTLGGVKTTSAVTSTSGLTACPIISGVPYYKDTNNTYTLSTFGITATAAELNVLDGITATVTELNYCDGVTANIQSQLNGKAASSHGTHVSYGTSASALGTSSAGSASTVSRSDHVHALPALTSCTGTLSIEKGGTGATDAATARSKLGITPANIGAANSSHLHSLTGDKIYGVLPIDKGGTAIMSNPSMLVNLESTSAASVFAESPRPGVTGVLPITNGGTGASSVAGIIANLGLKGNIDYILGEVDTGVKWYDGRTVYRRMIEVSTTTTGRNVTLVTLPDPIELINLFGYVNRGSGVYRFPPNWYGGNNNYHAIWMETTQDINAYSTAALQGFLILEYVK